MEVTTVFGSTWRIATGPEMLLILTFILLILMIFVLIKYQQSLKNQKAHEKQLLLFKAKHFGLTNFQYKILKGISEILHLNKPYDIVSMPDKFERAIASFISYISKSGEEIHDVLKICRDIAITYEKVYHYSNFRKPLENFDELEDGRLLYFLTPDKTVFIGKMTKDEKYAYIKLLTHKKDITPILCSSEVEVHFWRSGDGEYSFEAQIVKCENGYLVINKPEDMDRINAVRLPYMDVLIPCEISFPSDNPDIEKQKFRTTIFKINEQEFIIRTKNTLSFNNTYSVDFTISEFNVIADAKITADKAITNDHDKVNYYTFKFLNISDIAKSIIQKQITDAM